MIFNKTAILIENTDSLEFILNLLLKDGYEWKKPIFDLEVDIDMLKFFWMNDYLLIDDMILSTRENFPLYGYKTLSANSFIRKYKLLKIKSL
jgi:hypothetical protein